MSAKPKGKHLMLACGHEREWPRYTTASGSVWCFVCEAYRKIASVR